MDVEMPNDLATTWIGWSTDSYLSSSLFDLQILRDARLSLPRL